MASGLAGRFTGEPPRLFRRLSLLTIRPLEVGVVGLLKFDGRDVAVYLEQTVVVEPVDPVQRRGFDLVHGARRAVAADQFGLEQPDHGFGQGVVGSVAVGVGEAFGEGDRGS
jgi:hypothetical protein